MTRKGQTTIESCDLFKIYRPLSLFPAASAVECVVSLDHPAIVSLACCSVLISAEVSADAAPRADETPPPAGSCEQSHGAEAPPTKKST